MLIQTPHNQAIKGGSAKYCPEGMVAHIHPGAIRENIKLIQRQV